MSTLDDIRSGKGLPPISPKDERNRAEYIIPKSCELKDFYRPGKEPERHGRWIEKRYSYVCSCCGEPCKNLVLGKPQWNFCPWCGERMMTKGETIEYAIAKECRRNSLVEWCENWDIAIEEFEEFLRLGREAFDANIAGEQE